MKFSIENGSFIPGPSLTADKQGPGLKFSIETENFSGPSGTANHAPSPQKTFPYQVVFFWRVVCELSEPKQKAKYAPPPIFHSRVNQGVFVGVVCGFRSLIVGGFSFNFLERAVATRVGSVRWAFTPIPQGWWAGSVYKKGGRGGINSCYGGLKFCHPPSSPVDTQRALPY